MSFLDHSKGAAGASHDGYVLDVELDLERTAVLRGPPRRDGAHAVTEVPPISAFDDGHAAPTDSIITEAAPSEVTEYADFADAADSTLAAGPASTSGAGAAAGPAGHRAAAVGGAAGAAGAARLPLIGRLPAGVQRKLLFGAVIGGLVGLVGSALLALDSAARGAEQAAANGQALMQSQRLAKAGAQALAGDAAAFAELRDSAEVLSRNVRGLKNGDGALRPLPAALQDAIDPLLPVVGHAEKNAGVLLAQQPALARVAPALRAADRQSAELLAAAEAAAAAQLVTLTQRLGAGAHELAAARGAAPEVAARLRRDLDAFRDTLVGLTNGADGAADNRPPAAARDGTALERLAAIAKPYDDLRTTLVALLDGRPGVAAAQDAEAALVEDSDTLRIGLQTVQQRLADSAGVDSGVLLPLLASLLLLGCGAAGLLRLYVTDQSQRARVAEQSRLAAERLQLEARRVNDANQAAILRLMNELQAVAEGDLTQQATVTEDITGAIADSVNYTVEELRSLVSQVQGTANRVTATTEEVEQTSTDLLAASAEQLREIRDTGEAVLRMAGRINEVSGHAQETAQVAQASLDAAATGLAAVQDTIGGMHVIRDQIQDTSKRIKRLGESSQEIGEITELISDITEQTNVLALNAAIQAASAGEAGRGFSVVAEEVQRLAERSGDATRQIAALVKTIQTDTQDAVAAMERSTKGVVDGTRLTDAAGTALGDIDRVSRRLAELIEQISAQALGEARSANVVATNIQHIFAVTEQTGEGTRSTAQMVRELSKTAEDLHRSVARFKIG